MTEKPKHLYAKIRRMGGLRVVVTEGNSPLAHVVEEIPCTDDIAAQKTLRRVLKEIGAWY